MQNGKALSARQSALIYLALINFGVLPPRRGAYRRFVFEAPSANARILIIIRFIFLAAAMKFRRRCVK